MSPKPRPDHRRATLAEDDDAVDYSGIEPEDQLDLTLYSTKKPVWNDDIGAWTLNFNGRAKRASKKNFLLVSETWRRVAEHMQIGRSLIITPNKSTLRSYTPSRSAPSRELLCQGQNQI